MFNTPILFLVFNRPDVTRKVFKKIRQIKPKYLYIAADGPRKDNEGDADKCLLTRQIATAIDWDCEYKTLFQKSNLGCGKAVSNAISWFFDNVEQGIILEDDCLPSNSFFPFCQELLDKFKHNEKILLISGFNRLSDFSYDNHSYLFSKSAGIWGWATWKRAWGIYNFNVPEWQDENIKFKVLNTLPDDNSRIDMKYHLDLIGSDLPQVSWDYQWWFYRQLYDGLGIVPAQNLISNIGFGADATHTLDSNSDITKLKRNEIKFPLNHPVLISDYEAYTHALYLSPQRKNNKSFLMLLINSLKKKIKQWLVNY
jgi:hypothetical protein